MQVECGQMKTWSMMVLILLFLGGCSQDFQDVHITIEDFRFAPDQIRVQAGQPIRLVIRNQGRESHRFQSSVLARSTMKLAGKEENTDGPFQEGLTIPPGKTLEIMINLPVGDYGFRCPIRGHRGMRGRLLVKTAGRE